MLLTPSEISRKTFSVAFPKINEKANIGTLLISTSGILAKSIMVNNSSDTKTF